MRVGVYVDGFNLYYGGRSLCGRSKAGWRWLDIRSLASALLTTRTNWVQSEAHIERIVYCTARIDGGSNPSGHTDQDLYLKALRKANSVDYIEYGNYVARVKCAPLATEDTKGRPQIVRLQHSSPIKIRDGNGQPVRNSIAMVSYANWEEKGSDVNVASHLLIDTLSNRIDAAIVVSNDSDLKFPVHQARLRIPIGLINPSKSRLAGALQGDPGQGVGRHWWLQLQKSHFLNNQLSDPVGNYRKPLGW